MSSDTTDYFLDDLCLKITDGSHQSPKAFEDGMPMFSVKDMTEFGFDFSSVKTISRKDYEKLVDQGCRPLKDDVLIAKDGSVLKHVFKVEKDLDAVLLSSIALLRPNPELINPDYLVYSLMEPRLQNKIKSNYVSGSGVPRIVLKDFKKIPLSIPSLEYQDKIVDQLKSIDQKIHLNQQTNETLEAVAQAIFKSWFVDFDPVRAKIEAKSTDHAPNRAAMAAIAGISLEQDWDEIEAALDQKLARMSEAQQQQLSHTAQLFPDELVESEIGEVPKGWDSGNLEDICSVQGGYAFKSKLFKEEGYPVVKIKNINEDYTVDLKNGQFLSEEDILDKETYELNDGDYVLAMTGATVGKTGIIVSNSEKVMLNQRVAKFASDQFEGNINWFIHSAFLATNMKEQIVNLARGSAQPNISASGIESAELIIPSKAMIEEFLKIAEPLFKKWIDNYKQNETLSSLRDTLLPKLINGETTL